HARRRRAGEVPREAGIDPVAALRRLDPGEVGARGADAAPVDLALEARDVDAVDRVVRRAAAGPGDRVGIAEAVRDRGGQGDRAARRARTGAAAGEREGAEPPGDEGAPPHRNLAGLRTATS